MNTPARWTPQRFSAQSIVAVCALKSLHATKSRLRSLPRESREHLVISMFLDTIRALKEHVTAIYVTTLDTEISKLAGTEGCIPVAEAISARPELVDDPKPLHSPGRHGSQTYLNLALHQGLQQAHNDHPHAALMCFHPDLPCAQPHDFANFCQALNQHGRCYVADRHNMGTTCLGIPPQTRSTLPHLSFGIDSNIRYYNSGYVPVCADRPRLRGDVDTLADLWWAQQLGTGPHTQSWLRDRDNRAVLLRQHKLFPS